MNTKKNNFKTQNAKNTRRLSLFTLGWVLTLALATFGPQFLWNSTGLDVLAILINLVAGLFMILANRNYIKGLDELQKKIFMDAMAVTLGVTMVAGVTYSLLDTTNIIAQDAEFSGILVLMGITYFIAIIINQKRYS